ncbi:hypothetical protein [Lentilactobacillus farraginis]|uniref:Uncharacterized protein n=1 Tax=Lentilactobacillus farraginis DSM 18382 = JCM 14108 TaxID=1423743 RepID=A0A0R1VHU0_9LACO|nr:hypothetical protein [Lentilactobacillus farraginis]KRM05018.1 hypothetical protein FD41_GL000781 [Lentilactobacillus farraginis DSM 18382 = JCM 14108]
MDDALKKHDALNARRQFLTNEIGEAKLKEVITAVDALIDKENIHLYLLENIIQYRRSLNALPDL